MFNFHSHTKPHTYPPRKGAVIFKVLEALWGVDEMICNLASLFHVVLAMSSVILVTVFLIQEKNKNGL